MQIGRGRERSVQAGRVVGLARSFGLLAALGIIASLGCQGPAQAADRDDDDEPEASSTLPNLYLDLRTSYSTVPAGTLSIGFSNPSLSSAIAAFQRLAAAAGVATPAARSSSSQGVAIDVPLTMDFNDRISVYGGFSAGASQGVTSDWSTFAVTSWNVGLQADLYQQNGGSIPTVTLQATMTRSVPDSLLATTSLNTIVELDYALNADETRGLLAGVQDTRTAVELAASQHQPQSRRLCRRLLSMARQLEALRPRRRPVLRRRAAARLHADPAVHAANLRLDLDRNDDNDNRLFGVTAQISWTPKPAYQLIVRTPLYAVRN